MSSLPASAASAPSGDDHRVAAEPACTALLDQLPVGVCQLSPSRRILHANPAFCRLLRLPPGRLVHGLDFQAVTPAELSFRLEACLRSPLGRPAFGCRWRDTGDREVVVEVTVSPAPDGSVHLLIADATDRWLLEQARRQSQHYRGLATLAEGFAHEFNNVLAIIMGHACLLRDVTGDRQRVMQIGDIIIDASRRATALVRQVASFAGPNGAEKARLDLHEIVNRAIDRWRWPEAVAVSRDLRATDPCLVGVSSHIEQCLEHLLSNAIDAMPNGGTLTVSTDLTTRLPRGHPGAPAPFVHLTIADTGCGMDRATLASLFEPPGGPEAGSRHRGLGLTVVAGIVRAHHGFIEVDSTPRTGTRVNIFFPCPLGDTIRPGRSPGGADPASAGDPALKRRTLLMVEDEPDIGALMMEIFRRHGISVLWARDAEEGLRLYQRHSAVIGAVFTDVGLPGMDGLELSRQLRQIAPGLPLLIASGYLHSGDQIEPAAAPTLFLKKPYEYGDVVAKIGQLLGAQEFSAN